MRIPGLSSRSPGVECWRGRNGRRVGGSLHEAMTRTSSRERVAPLPRRKRRILCGKSPHRAPRPPGKPSKSGSQWTRRWRETDSNPRSPLRRTTVGGFAVAERTSARWSEAESCFSIIAASAIRVSTSSTLRWSRSPRRLSRNGREISIRRRIEIVTRRHFIAWISGRAKSAPGIHFHVRRTYSGRPSSSMRFSAATAMPTSVVCRPSVLERSALPITRL